MFKSISGNLSFRHVCGRAEVDETRIWDFTELLMKYFLVYPSAVAKRVV